MTTLLDMSQGWHAPTPVQAERFWSDVTISGQEDCWQWTGEVTHNGYGVFRLNHKTHMAHRVAYELVGGVIPKGLDLDHLCHTRDTGCEGGPFDPHRSCVNPRHLEPVTHAENMARGSQASQTHCKRGHEFTPENTLIRPPGNGDGTRRCIACRRLTARIRERAERRAAR